MSDDIERINEQIAGLDEEKLKLREQMIALQTLRDQLSLQADQLGFADKYPLSEGAVLHRLCDGCLNPLCPGQCPFEPADEEGDDDDNYPDAIVVP